MAFSPTNQVDVCEGPERILITSESHLLLFNHDEEIIGRSHEELMAANQKIRVLKERLREVTENYDTMLCQLYEDGIARSSKVHSRITLRRHLRLELHLYQTQAQAYYSLNLRYQQTAAELDAMNTLNDMWRQELEHDKCVMDSMATKLSSFEGETLTLSESWEGSAHTPRQLVHERAVESNVPSYKSSHVLSAGSVTSESTVTSPASDSTFMDDSPPVSITQLSP